MSEILKSLESLYSEGKFQEAIDLTLKNEAQFERPKFHYNLGTLYIKNNQLSEARYHLEVAKILGFKPSMVENNIGYIKENLSLVLVEQPRSFEGKYYQAVESFSREALITVFLILVLLAIFIVKKFKNYWLSSFCVLIALAFPLAKIYQNHAFQVGIIKEASPLKEGPSAIFEQTTELPQGLKVFTSEVRDGNWYYIEFPETYRGWVNSSFLKVLGK